MKNNASMDGSELVYATGLNKCTPATKDNSKTPYHLVSFDFIKGMANNMRKGIEQDEGRMPGDWQLIEWTEETANHYRDAIIRHLVEGFDPYAIACNAMIIAFHEGWPK